jgi:hypothetical protein
VQHLTKGSESYPLLPISPGITYSFAITLTDDKNGTITITGFGEHDGFPGFEVFVQLQGLEAVRIYEHDPEEAGYTGFSLVTGPDVQRPLKPLEVRYGIP